MCLWNMAPRWRTCWQCECWILSQKYVCLWLTRSFMAALVADEDCCPEGGWRALLYNISQGSRHPVVRSRAGPLKIPYPSRSHQPTFTTAKLCTLYPSVPRTLYQPKKNVFWVYIGNGFYFFTTHSFTNPNYFFIISPKRSQRQLFLKTTVSFMI